jgi:polysaccharide biosynthesis protein PslJ
MSHHTSPDWGKGRGEVRSFPLADRTGLWGGTPSWLHIEQVRAHPWLAAAVAVLAGASFGVWVASAGVLVPSVVTLVALFMLLTAIRAETGVIGAVGVITLLPFAVVPVRFGLSPTFLDISLSVVLVAWLYRATREGRPLVGGFVNVLVLIYLGLAIASFLLGLTYGISPERLRLFFKGINSTLFFFTVLNCTASAAELRRYISALLIGGAAAACLALVLLAIPPHAAEAVLSSLAPLGYPSGPGVLRPIADTETLRATGTSIDPNVLGGLLMIVSTLLAAQVLSAKPVLDRRLLWLMAVPVLAALLLTYSRTAWGGAMVAIAVIATVRYRRLWFVALGAAVLMLLLPQGQMFVERFLSGLAFQDRAAVMRLGEYRDALNLISMYPWFGIGFGETPAIGLYLGVSSMYLLIGQEMGLIGLSSLLLVLAMVTWQAVAAYRDSKDEEARGLLLTTGSVLAAILAAGLFDHYFTNILFPHMVALFWMCIALVVAATRHARQGATSHSGRK